jgi:hypothetical protein
MEHSRIKNKTNKKTKFSSIYTTDQTIFSKNKKTNKKLKRKCWTVPKNSMIYACTWSLTPKKSNFTHKPKEGNNVEIKHKAYISTRNKTIKTMNILWFGWTLNTLKKKVITEKEV